MGKKTKEYRAMMATLDEQLQAIHTLLTTETQTKMVRESRGYLREARRALKLADTMIRLAK
jgi:hypothetical protein